MVFSFTETRSEAQWIPLPTFKLYKLKVRNETGNLKKTHYMYLILAKTLQVFLMMRERKFLSN